MSAPLKVAIVGLSPDSHEDAPWNDPDWEIWGLPWDVYWHRCDLLFDMHDKSLFVSNGENDAYEGGNIPIYMQQKFPEIPSSMEYPLSEISNVVGDYFGSSPAYMIAMAIYEGADEIGLWGINLSDSIYDHQRPNIEYLIGFARGRGSKVTVNGPTSLFSHKVNDQFNGKRVIYPVRYGYI